ncbi:MAG: hypothetical protein GXO26_08410 [Crenarchaeota archaeon]|nr:hypothetical protein [Thermoproteota archaeon]
MNSEKIRKTVEEAFEKGHSRLVLREEKIVISLEPSLVERLRRYCNGFSWMTCDHGYTCISNDRTYMFYIGDISKCTYTEKPASEKIEIACRDVLKCWFINNPYRMEFSAEVDHTCEPYLLSLSSTVAEMRLGRDAVNAIREAAELGAHGNAICICSSGRIRIVTDRLELETNVNDVESVNLGNICTCYDPSILRNVMKIDPISGRVMFRRRRDIEERMGALDLHGRSGINALVAPKVL